MRKALVGTVLIIGALTLAACGETPGCRALTGGAIGAAGGAALGAIGGNPGLGALAGGAAGAATRRVHLTRCRERGSVARLLLILGDSSA